MERIYKIFISATKKNMEFERSSLINTLLMNNCYPITMEYFINSNNESTLSACLKGIKNADSIMLILKDNYGEYIPKKMIADTFSNICPFKASGYCSCIEGDLCKYSFTHFEYLYASLLNKMIFVMVHEKLFTIDENCNKVYDFLKQVNLKGCYNVYSGKKNFDVVSSAIIAEIKQKCKENSKLGLVSAEEFVSVEELKTRLALFENSYNNGFIPLKNYMGCIIDDRDLTFYVYKELKMKKERRGFDFSIHINTDQRNFEGRLSQKLIKAHAYVRYSTINGFSNFVECAIQERSYGREYLNCHISFCDTNGVILPINERKVVGVLYTYQVDKALYGNEIGRKPSPFLEETLVELKYNKNRKININCYEKKENSLIMLDSYDYESIKPVNNSFITNILSDKEAKDYIYKKYLEGFNESDVVTHAVTVPLSDTDGKEQTMHFYIRWEE